MNNSQFNVGDMVEVLETFTVSGCGDTWKKGETTTVTAVDVEGAWPIGLSLSKKSNQRTFCMIDQGHLSKLRNLSKDNGFETEQVTRLFHSYTVYKGKDAELWHCSDKKTVKIKEGRKSRTVSVADVADLPSFVEGFFASKA